MQETTPLISGPAPASYPVATETGYPSSTSQYPPSTGYPPAYPSANAPYSNPPYAPSPSPYPPPYAPENQYGAPLSSAPPPHALPPPYAPAPSVTPGGLMAVPCRVCAQSIEYH